MLIDAHTHLNLEDLFVDRKTHLSNFQAVGGKILVNAGAHSDYNQKGILIAQEAKHLFPELIVKATVGFHPEDTPLQKEGEKGVHELLDELEQQYLNHKEEVIAIGECGIDLHTKTANLVHQQELFRLHAELAHKFQLPLVVHSRDAFKETLEILKDFRDLKIYFHCRGYGAKEVHIIEKLFPEVWLGFTNILTYPNAHLTTSSFLAIKKAKRLLETDAPFLPPQAFRGKMNFPEYITYGYTRGAQLLGMAEETLEKQVAENFFMLFPAI
ncbi:MAG: TatD family hydrolase [Candidatus Peribacteria bacterium]|jgi:TatD DNase family protein|nr:TatD family hydrolase [Candidatus Peribacteria bacterium]